ncbi:MAG TPA: TetR/AcrR family transcriptional regulator [Mycobacterium sp.]
MTQLPDDAGPGRRRRRDKLEPNPQVRREILAAASISLRENGVRGLNIAAVLERTNLSTRAFYRHFNSMDDLVAAVFQEAARVERRRLQRRMAGAATPIEAVAAWIDGRLDLAFDARIGSDLRRLSLEAQFQTSASPALVEPAYAEMLKPLADALQQGLQDKVFHPIDPATEARFVHGVVWAGINQQWTTGECDRDDLRRHILGFCLRGLGVAPHAINRICADAP